MNDETDGPIGLKGLQLSGLGNSIRDYSVLADGYTSGGSTVSYTDHRHYYDTTVAPREHYLEGKLETIHNELSFLESEISELKEKLKGLSEDGITIHRVHLEGEILALKRMKVRYKRMLPKTPSK